MLDKLKFPANAMMVNEFLIDFATFDLIPVELLDKEIFYWPDIDPFSANFESAGIESLFFLSNIGLVQYIILLHIFMAIIYACLKIKKKATCQCIEKLKTKLKNYLYWKG